MKIWNEIAITMTKGDREIYPICFPHFIKHMAAILVFVAARTAETNFPKAETNGVYVGGGKGKESPDKIDIINVLNGNDIIRGTSLFMQISGFLEWFMEQESPNGDETMWYDFDFIANKWNEYAVAKNTDGGAR